MSGKIPKYTATLGVCLLLSWIYVVSQGFAQAALAEKFRILCDACTLPGVLLMLGAALWWAIGKGGLGMRFRRRAEKPWDLGVFYRVGGIFVSLSLIFLVLYFFVSPS